jgi:hypothetical protein
MFGVGAELADADDDDDDAHPAATSDPAAMDRRESCLTGDRGLGTGDWGLGAYERPLTARLH